MVGVPGRRDAPIHVYTRAQSLEDGTLRDVTSAARDAGFRLPAAVTASVWADCVAVGKLAAAAGQSESGRLRDVLWMALLGAGAARAATDRIRFTVVVDNAGVGMDVAPAVELEMVCHPGDALEPVLTVQFPGED